MKYPLTLIFVLFTSLLFAQSPTYQDLINKVQAQEINFPFPQKDTLVTAGEININNNNPTITYFIPLDSTYHVYSPGFPESSRDLGLPGPNRTVYVFAQNFYQYFRNIDINTHLRFKLRFTITNWVSSANNLTVGIGSQKQTVANGTSEIIFDNVLETMASIGCYTNNLPPPRVNSLATDRTDRYFFNINWQSAGAGIVTLPVMPVKIIYAPVVDCKQSNTSSITTTNSQGYNLGFSINKINNTTTPIPSSLDNTDDILNQMNDMGEGMSVYPDPDVQAVGKALSFISSTLKAGIGSSTINQTISNSVTDQHTLSITTTETETVVAKSSNGGPGEGDVICFYTEVNLLWYQINGKMHLSLLGFNPTLKTPAVSDLKQALVKLANKPKGTKDSTWLVDAESIQNLLSLDPFTGPDGVKTQLDSNRFTIAHKPDGTNAAFQNGGADITEGISHQITQTDGQSTVQLTSTVEVDKPGFLSFLGLGETETKTIQSSFSKSSSSQVTVGEMITDNFTLHGQALCDHYYCEAYFDNVFGTFVFRDNSDDLDFNNIISGTVSSVSQKGGQNTSVLLKVGDKSYWTRTDKEGKFQFILPRKFKRQSAVITAGSSTVRLRH